MGLGCHEAEMKRRSNFVQGKGEERRFTFGVQKGSCGVPAGALGGRQTGLPGAGPALCCLQQVTSPWELTPLSVEWGCCPPPKAA